MNTNIDGRIKVPFALTSIKGVGRRFSFVCLRKADVDVHKRAGELTEEEVNILFYFILNIGEFLFRFEYLFRLIELFQLYQTHVNIKSQIGF